MNNLTELVFVLDMSGSMYELTEDTIGGFNGLIDKQKKEEGECLVSTVLFNDLMFTLHDRVKLQDIPRMTEKEYQAGGSTALIDALGNTIEHIDTIHRYARAEDVPAHTLFIIMTDGMENASRKFSSGEVKKMVEAHKEKGWEFLFIGANIDAVETAGTYGIAPDRAVDYIRDKKGTKISYKAINRAVGSVRRNEGVCDSWCAEVAEDYKIRGGEH